MAAVAAEVAEGHELTVEALRAPTRARRIAHARQEAMTAMRQIRRSDGRVRYSYAQIAGFFGLSRHTTVLYAVKACGRRGAEAATAT